MSKQKYKITVLKVRNGEWKVGVNGTVYATISGKPDDEAREEAMALAMVLKKRFNG